MNMHEAKMSLCQSTRDGLEQFASGAARVGRGALAGLIGGAIAAYVMNRYQEIESRPVNVRRQEQSRREYGQTANDPGESKAQLAGDPKVQLAQRVSRNLFDHELSDIEQMAVGPAIHYGYGAAVGALYGGLAELMPTIGMGMGIPYATLLWLGGDEIALPALGVAAPPTQTPPARHASHLASHFVYGITLDVARRILRRLL